VRRGRAHCYLSVRECLRYPAAPGGAAGAGGQHLLRRSKRPPRACAWRTFGGRSRHDSRGPACSLLAARMARRISGATARTAAAASAAPGGPGVARRLARVCRPARPTRAGWTVLLSRAGAAPVTRPSRRHAARPRIGLRETPRPPSPGRAVFTGRHRRAAAAPCEAHNLSKYTRFTDTRGFYYGISQMQPSSARTSSELP
jgi:hypothetical protein